MSALLSALVLFAASQPATADVAAQGEGTVQAAADADLKPGQRRTKMVCRVETPTGSRFGKRVCMTQEDIARRTEESERGFGEMQKAVNTTFSRGN